MGAGRRLCRAPDCVELATQEFAAEGTQARPVEVCNDAFHERWAKKEIAADFPGHSITASYLDTPDDCWTQPNGLIDIDEFYIDEF